MKRLKIISVVVLVVFSMSMLALNLSNLGCVYLNQNCLGISFHNVGAWEITFSSGESCATNGAVIHRWCKPYFSHLNKEQLSNRDKYE